MKWQPIETAPKDGTWVLLYGGKPEWSEYEGCTPPMGAAFYDGEWEHWRFCSYDSGYYGEWENPTHWMPLPELPEGDWELVEGFRVKEYE